jgi:hypothetical protein
VSNTAAIGGTTQFMERVLLKEPPATETFLTRCRRVVTGQTRKYYLKSKKHGVHIQYCVAGLVKTVILSSGQGGFSPDVIWALGNSLRHHFEPGCLGVP